jgi:dTDP-4-dehydrorhamnose reductase
VVSDLFGTPTYTPNLVVFLLNKITKSAFASNMEHFSDGKTMSWYELAKKIVGNSAKVNKVESKSLKLKARRGVNTALK